MVDGWAAVDDREFPIVRRGYDRKKVKAYLGEVEVSFRQLERWAEDAKARLRVAEEKGRRHYDVDEAMVAVFAAKDRVLERGRLRAERIEAEAREQARVDYEAAAAAIIGEAEEEAGRILEGALTSVRVQYESILGEARSEADGIIVEARAEADRMIEEARAEAGRMIKQAHASVTNSEDAPLRAERIEAEAKEQARVDYEDAAAAIIGEAEEEARRIVEGGLVTSERVQYESILGDARAEADGIIVEARAEADRMIEEARAEAGRMIKQAHASVTNSEDAPLRAERIEAEAKEQARIDYEKAAAAIIGEAEEEARRIVEGGLVTSERVQYESILGDARAEADRIVEEARAEADRMIKQAHASATNSEDAPDDSLVVDLTHDGGADEAENDGAPRRTRYERRSANLPSIGEDASDVLRSLKSLREASGTD